MNHLKIFLCVLFIGFGFATQPIFGQNQKPGLYLKEVKVKTLVYEIKITGLGGPTSASNLDNMLGSREGVISANTDHLTSICRLEATKDYDRKLIEYLLGIQGLGIAKSFE